MFLSRSLSAGLAFGLIVTLAPTSAHAQGCRGPGMSGNSAAGRNQVPGNGSYSQNQPMPGNYCPNQYQFLITAQLRAGMYQQSLMYPSLAYQQAGYNQAMQQQTAYGQIALMMNASAYQQQQLQMMNSPGGPAATPAAFAQAGFVDPLLRPVVAAPAPAQAAPPPAMVRDPFGKPAAVRDPVPVVRDPAPVRELPGLEVPALRSKEEEAASKLKLAKLLERDGLVEKARTRYNEIAEKFPGTKAAEEAETLLAKK